VNTAVWWLEWRLAARRPRVFVLSMAVPLALVAALAFGRAPTPHAALVYTVLFTFFGTFGAGIPWARDSERGLIHRLMLTGIDPAWAVVQRWLASALLDLVQLLPSLALIAWWYRAEGGEALRLVGLVAAGLLAANALGLLVAALARSLAETALLASVAALLLLHAAGVFRAPEPGTTAATIERVVPFHYMHAAIKEAVGAP
jgi:ABC-type transport system involved in cytochrome c biogenesis permease component